MVFSASQYFPCLIQFYQLALNGSSAIPRCAAHSLAPIPLALNSIQNFTHNFPTLPIIWALVAEKLFLQNPTWCPFKIKK
jgi:hypothetical protein